MKIIAKLPCDPKSKAWAAYVDFIAKDRYMLELSISGRESQFEVFLSNSFNGLIISIPSENICCTISSVKNIADNHKMLAARMNQVDAATIVCGIAYYDDVFEDLNLGSFYQAAHSANIYMSRVCCDCCYIYDAYSPFDPKPEKWKILVNPLAKSEKTMELLLTVNGQTICVVLFDGEYERIVSIPDINTSCPIARLDDIFWNSEKLFTVMNLSLAASIACAISHVDEVFAEYFDE